MSPDQAVASVNSVKGQAFARGPDGALRPLTIGDPLFDGETLIADPGSRVEVAHDDGSPPYQVDGPMQLAMAGPELADDAEISPEALEEMVSRFKHGEDFPPPEAGGGGGSRPHNLVILERILEPVTPASNEYAATPLRGEGPYNWFSLSASSGGSRGSGGDSNPPDTNPQRVADDHYQVTENTHTTQGNILSNDGSAGVQVAQVRFTDVLGNVCVEDVPPEGFKFPTELGGTVWIFQDGTFRYDAPVRDHGGRGYDSDGPDIDHFEYRAWGADGNLSDWATVNIDILDTVPVANDDEYFLGPDDGATEYFKGNVMDNDEQSADWISRPDEHNAVWKVRTGDGGTEIDVSWPGAGGVPTAVTTANGGTVWIKPDGTFEYNPASHFVGDDSFQYQLNDGDGSPSGWATVTFHVEGPDQPPGPVATDDDYQVTENTHTTQGSVLSNDDSGVQVVQVRFTDVLGNVCVEDVPPEGFKFPTELGGTVWIFQDGTFTYDAPVRDQGGRGYDSDGPDIDHFEYCAKDASGNVSGWATVNIDILDTVPVANDDAYFLGPEDGATEYFKGNVMDNDEQSADWISRADGERNAVWSVRTADGETEITVSWPNADGVPTAVTTAGGGTVWIKPDGTFEYNPASHFEGEDSFQYQLNDGDGSPSDWATATFHVEGPLAPDNLITGGFGFNVLDGTDGTVDVFKWTLADLDGGGTLVTNTLTHFNAAEGDKLDLRDLLQDGDDYLFDASHLDVSFSGGNTTIAVSPVDSSAPALNIVIEGVDLTGGYHGQDAIDQLLKNGNLVDDK